MSIVKLHFHGSKSIGSKLVRWFTGGKFSHVSIEIDDIYCHAVLLKGTYIRQELDIDVVHTESLVIPSTIRDDILTLIREWTEESYDVKAILGYILKIKINGSSSNYCSEQAREVLNLLYDYPSDNNRFHTPHEIYVSAHSYNQGVINSSI